ncbi:MAG: flagellar filament capping protein FliD [Planctomycetes bacterium]|nr:flagellar filament capping protein FliD [Planctomycetota bacterium]
MSGISSGIGLLSGLPTASIIDQLIAIESRPLFQLQVRVRRVQEQRTAFAQLAARLLGLKSIADRFDDSVFFNIFSANSSDDGVLTASAGENAVTGSFQFQVKSLVTNHQLVSRGFTDSDRTPVGIGRLTLEIGHGRLDTPTPLDLLNGGEGVRRGIIEILDSDGNSATIDLSTTLTVQDVLDAINDEISVKVFARAEGDHLVIEDRASGEGSLVVADVGGGQAARDLGIAQEAGQDGRIVGDRILYLVDDSQLKILNDGNSVSVGKTNQDIDITIGARTFTIGLRGVLQSTTNLAVLNNGHGVRTGTFRITNRAGDSAEIVIDDSVVTIGGVLDAINNAGIDVRASTLNGQIQIADDSAPSDGQGLGNLIIEDVSGQAAQDLGIVVDTDQTSVLGNEVYRITTLGDVIRAINYAVDSEEQANDVIQAQISANGRGIELTRLNGNEEFTLSVAEGAVNSEAAQDLGLIGTSANGTFVTRDVLAGMNTTLLVSLNGGGGVATGEIRLKSADGESQALVDLSGAATVLDVIDRVNAVSEASNITARLNDAGNGIVFEDQSGADGTMRIKDITGTTVRDLFRLEAPGPGVVVSTDGALDTGNVQIRYVARSTSVDELNHGRGVAAGSFRITARNGQSFSVNITKNQTTVGDILDVINGAAVDGVEARINANGDGIEIVDQTEGTGNLSVTSTDGATTAADLNIEGQGVDFVGEDDATQQRIDGSFEFQVDIDADDTLQDVRDKISALGIDVSATIINDGTGSNPFRLIIGSEISGTRGRLVFDGGGTGLATETLVRAQDAVVLFGGSGAENPIILTSATNTLNGVLEDVTINLVGTSDTPVSLAISQDIDRVVSDLRTFVSSYNAVLDQIDEFTSFDAETNARGTLFGDTTVDLVRNRLRRAITARVSTAPPGFDRLTTVGLRTGSGGRLSFDETTFRALYGSDPEAIETLFTDPEEGAGVQLASMLDDLTRSFDGVLSRKDNLLNSREELFNDRIEALQALLDAKRARLERTFRGLETTLASLQAQQAALGSLSIIGGTF